MTGSIEGGKGSLTGDSSRKRLPEQDELRRRPLARTIAELIHNAPSERCLRIGVYGRWGEGKTTLLRYVQSYLEERGHYVTWLAPWDSQDLIQLWTNFYLKVTDRLPAAS